MKPTNDFYIITPEYVSLAVIGLHSLASSHATRFEAETTKDAQLIGEELASSTYPEHMDWKIISEAEKMRIDGQPELFILEE